MNEANETLSRSKEKKILNMRMEAYLLDNTVQHIANDDPRWPFSITN